MSKSSNYWRKREREWKKADLRDEAKYIQEIQDIYSTMLTQINKEIESFFVRYSNKEGMSMAEAKRKASDIDIKEYEKKAKKYVKEKDFSKEANEQLRLYNLAMKVNRLELLKANIGLELTAGSDELVSFTKEKLEGAALEQIQRNAGILGDTIVDNTKTANTIANSSFKNATFSERIWSQQDLLKNDLYGILSTALIQGRNPREFIPKVRKSFDVTRYQAERLLRTELTRVRIQAQAESYEANGIDEYEYVACGLKDVCPICKVLDKQIFKLKDMEPGENAPPMHPNCHCSTAPYSDRKVYEQWLNGLANGDHDLRFDEWKEQLSANKKVSSKLGDEKVYITEQAINKVKPIEFEGLLDAVGLQELHKEVLKKSMDDNDSDEVLTIVKVNNYDDKVITFGSARSVNPNKNIKTVAMMQESDYQSVYWLHNHGFTNEFSYDDLGCFYDEKVKAVTIVTNKGKIAVLNKTKNYNFLKFRDIILEERDKYEKPVEHADEIAEAILKRHNECGIQWIR